MDNNLKQPRGRFALTNGHIILPDRVVTGQALVIEGAKIVGLVNTAALASDIEPVDVGRRWIVPGLMDLLVHGGMGRTFGEATQEAFASITRENLRHGVTSLFAATVALPIPRLVEFLNFGRSWMKNPPDGARVLGLYLEGPYISSAQAGALDPQCIRMPTDGSLTQLLEHRDVLKVMVMTAASAVEVRVNAPRCTSSQPPSPAYQPALRHASHPESANGAARIRGRSATHHSRG